MEFIGTLVVTYTRTTPAPSLSLFIPYKFLVCMMIKLRITKEKKKGEHYKTAETKGLSSFLSIKAYAKRPDAAYF